MSFLWAASRGCRHEAMQSQLPAPRHGTAKRRGFIGLSEIQFCRVRCCELIKPDLNRQTAGRVGGSQL